MSATLRDSYTGENNELPVYSGKIRFTHFQASSNYKATSVKVKVWKTSNPGTSATVSIRAGVDDGSGIKWKPTGSDLASGTFDPSVLGTSSPGSVVTVSLGDGCDLVSGNHYVVVMSVVSGDTGNYVNWRENYAGISSPPYNEGFSSDNINWSVNADREHYYEIWGEDISKFSPFPTFFIS